MESDRESQETYATVGPSASPEADISVVEDHGGPEPYQFKPLASAPIMPKAGALGAEAMQG